MSDYNERRLRREYDAKIARIEEQASQTRNDLQRALQRIEHLELWCEALAKLGEVKQLFKPDELQTMVVQLDLLDGVEDRKRGKPRSRAPRCHQCQHFVNPARDVCVYCGTPQLRPSAQSGDPYRGGGAPEASVKVAFIDCSACDKEVPQTEAYFSNDGELVCNVCFLKPRARRE